jgi:hypothetical protein
VPGDSWIIVANVLGTDDDSPLLPAVAYKAIGKGRVVFSSVPWERQYHHRRDPHLARWLREVVLWLGNRPLPLQVSGSRLLHLGTTRVLDGWLLYLVNSSNDVQDYFVPHSLAAAKVAEHPLPVGTIDIAVPGAREARAIYGPEPDWNAVTDDTLCVQYTDFRDHVVLHVR